MIERKPTELLIQQTLLNMMEERPIEQIKVTHLTERAHISRTTFYLYYGSTFDVLQQIEDDFFEAVLERGRVLNRPADDELDAEIKRRLGFYQDNMRALKALYGYYGDEAFQAKVTAKGKEVLAIHSRRFDAQDARARLAQEFIAAGQKAVLRYWFSHEDEVSLDDMATVVYRILRVAPELAQ